MGVERTRISCAGWGDKERNNPRDGSKVWRLSDDLLFLSIVSPSVVPRRSSTATIQMTRINIQLVCQLRLCVTQEAQTYMARSGEEGKSTMAPLMKSRNTHTAKRTRDKARRAYLWVCVGPCAVRRVCRCFCLGCWLQVVFNQLRGKRCVCCALVDCKVEMRDTLERKPESRI